jgi:hypothetical protein|tara:strand:+ start:261 stop:899 length:639 start_codon:yes stop_codon:yes gene_type:complete
MAVVEPKSAAVSLAQPAGQMFTVDIAMSGFLDTETVNGGRCSPCAADDFATKPTTLAQSLLVSRGQLRFKMMMEALAVRSNFSVHNIVTTYASDAGDNPITDINFTLVFDTADFVPTTGTTIDGSTTTTTKALYIQDKIAEALNTTRTEKMSVFNPTSGAGEISDIEVTAGPVLTASIGEIVEAITVAEVTTFRPNTANQTPTDNALSYTAE